MEQFIYNHIAKEALDEIEALCLDYEVTRDYRREKFREIRGLDEFSSLTRLEIANHAIDVLDFESLPEGLLHLDLRQNSIREIWPKPGSGLEFLDLSLNELEDASGLSGMESLKELNLAHNHFIEFSSLPEFPNLEVLALSGHRALRSLPIARKFPRLEALFLSGCLVQNWMGLKHWPALESLFVTPSAFEPFANALLSIPELRSLTIAAGRLSGRIEIPLLKNLRYLAFNKGFEVAEIVGLGQLPALKELDLSRNGLNIIPELPDQLEILDIRNNRIQHIDPMALPSALKRLRITGNAVQEGIIPVIMKTFPDLLID